MNADSFEGVIRKAYPVPNETFARAKWMGEAADTCGMLARQYAREEASLTHVIRENGLTSERYELKELRRPYATVNLPLLKKNEPEVYEAAVHVRQAFAEATIGRRRLYDLVAEAIGDEITAHEVVTVSDVRRMLPSAEASLYVQEGEEFVKYAVVEK